MTRDEFQTLLRRLTQDGVITEEEAEDLLRRFDNGELPENLLPLPDAQVRTFLERTGDDTLVLALLLLLVLIGGGNRRYPVRQFFRLSEAAKERLSLLVVEDFERRVQEAADELTRTGDVRAWHTRMQVLIRDNLLMQAQLGKAGVLNAVELERIRRTLLVQMAYLQRFADTIAVGIALGRPLSVRAVRHRARMYGGAGYSAFWRLKEAQEAEEGYVYEFVGADDGGTCSSCLEAMEGSPYLAGEGPMPGAGTCLGGGACRHRRRRKYDPEAYERLVQERVAA